MKRVLPLICLVMSSWFISNSVAGNQVVVVPLGKSATGDATVTDVVVGKTFSNSMATGLTGVRNLAPVRRTGQTPTNPYNAPSGSDGDLQKGVSWPLPRFSQNNDGTVTDNLTGLIWLKNANCFNFFPGDISVQNQRDWNAALLAANQLAEGYCGLTDGSDTGDWHLPNILELLSLTDYRYSGPALTNTAGTGQGSDGDPFILTGLADPHYWTSTASVVIDPANKWLYRLNTGELSVFAGFIPAGAVWPVRGGY